MDGSSSSSIQPRYDVVLPLVVCNRCKVGKVQVKVARTTKNYGRSFYICPRYKQDGSGCDFWYWEEEYEDFLIDNCLVPSNYQRVFNKNMKMQSGCPVVYAQHGEDNVEGAHNMNLVIQLLREVVVLLKVHPLGVAPEL
ncbi:hypothetical protein BS78_06G002400 [Paspalum vaginatum]|nr:hypothetical protein BS78_06G002400 [Paspalum vaginatum]